MSESKLLAKISLIFIAMFLFSSCYKSTITDVYEGTYWCDNAGYNGDGMRFVIDDGLLYSPWEKDTPIDGQIMTRFALDIVTSNEFTAKPVDSDGKYLNESDENSIIIMISKGKELSYKLPLANSSEIIVCKFISESTTLFPWK